MSPLLMNKKRENDDYRSKSMNSLDALLLAPPFDVVVLQKRKYEKVCTLGLYFVQLSIEKKKYETGSDGRGRAGGGRLKDLLFYSSECEPRHSFPSYFYLRFAIATNAF